jgi:hypothetical protein
MKTASIPAVDLILVEREARRLRAEYVAAAWKRLLSRVRLPRAQVPATGLPGNARPSLG